MLPSTAETVVDESRAERRFDGLFDTYGRAVYAFARRRASADDADEVVAETFLVAWRRLDEVPEAALPWLLGVARRCLANLTRGQARQSALRRRLASVRQADSGPVGLSDATRRALERLSPAEREVVTLLAWDGLTPDEAAVALGCTRAAIYLRLHRARRRLATITTEESS